MNVALECEVAAAGLLVVVFDLISALILLLMIFALKQLFPSGVHRPALA